LFKFRASAKKTFALKGLTPNIRKKVPVGVF